MTSGIKHTLGPWTVDEHFNIRALNCANTPYDWAIAETRRGPMTTLYEVKANALLIAAAPELLEALEFITRCAKIEMPYGGYAYCIGDEYMDRAKQAIAKAQGRG